MTTWITLPDLMNLDCLRRTHSSAICLTVRQSDSLTVRSNNMSFLAIKDPAKRTALVDEYVKAMKTVRQRNMMNREMKLAIEELQTHFHSIVSATKQAAEKTAE